MQVCSSLPAAPPLPASLFLRRACSQGALGRLLSFCPADARHLLAHATFNGAAPFCCARVSCFCLPAHAMRSLHVRTVGSFCCFSVVVAAPRPGPGWKDGLAACRCRSLTMRTSAHLLLRLLLMLTSHAIPPVFSQEILKAGTILLEQPVVVSACLCTAKLIIILNILLLSLHAATAELLMRRAVAPGAGQLQLGAARRQRRMCTRQARLKAARQPRLPRLCRACLVCHCLCPGSCAPRSSRRVRVSAWAGTGEMLLNFFHAPQSLRLHTQTCRRRPDSRRYAFHFGQVCDCAGSVYRASGVGRNATPAHPARVVMQIPRIWRGP